MKTTFRKITATLLAILSVLFTFCVTSFASEKTGGAKVTIGGETVYFTDISEAWNAASTSKKEATMVLFEDWKGDSSCSMGTGKGFYKGAVLLEGRKKPLTLDLNGYKIDRQCYTSTDDGSVFIIRKVRSFVITDSSEKGTSSVEGGYTTGDGGAFNVFGSEIKVENITIKNNYSLKKGGAFCASSYSTVNSDNYSDVIIDNCVITENSAKRGGAFYLNSSNNLSIYDTTVTKNIAEADGGIHTEVCGLCNAKIVLGGKVIIKDNKTLSSGTGLMLDENLITKVAISYDKNRPLTEDSEIVVLSKTSDKTLRLTFEAAFADKDCFRYENDSYRIVEKGSGSSKYLDLVKN